MEIDEEAFKTGMKGYSQVFWSFGVKLCFFHQNDTGQQSIVHFNIVPFSLLYAQEPELRCTAGGSAVEDLLRE